MNKIPAILFVLLAACQSPAPMQPKQNNYPDVKGFFQQEIHRLNKLQPLIDKEVRINEQQESQKISKINWTYELDLFYASDINKPAFKGLYQIHKQGSEEIYTASDAKLRTREIRISRTSDKRILKLSVHNFSQNVLYSTDEWLEYCPDSIYRISKHQDVLLLGKNDYQVKGKFRN